MTKAQCRPNNKGVFARISLSLFALAALLLSLQPAFAQGVTRAVGDPSQIGISQLASYYRQMETQLVSQGYLRQDRRAGGLDSETLAENFMAIAMRSEYSLRGGSASHSGHAAPLRRWEQPIRVGLVFGPSVGAAQRRQDTALVGQVASRLQRASRHPISLANSNTNFHILVLNDEERANARSILRQLAPQLSRAAQNAVLRMRPNTFCMVIAIPGSDAAQGYQQAIAIVRAEHPPRMRQSCIEEEMAQGMGLPNDSPNAHHSIFNDNEEFGVLTRHDELLLRMLYHDSLTCGMSPRAVGQQVEHLAQLVLASG